MISDLHLTAVCLHLRECGMARAALPSLVYYSILPRTHGNSPQRMNGKRKEEELEEGWTIFRSYRLAWDLEGEGGERVKGQTALGKSIGLPL